MAEPLLRVRASGYGGSGYLNPWTGERVIGVTTALGSLDKGGIVQWSVDQTIGYMLANKDAVYNRTSEQAYGFLRWYHKRAREADFDDPNVDLHSAHVGVLNDLAELGTMVHEWIEAYLTGGFTPDLVRPEQVQMVEAFLDWEAEHEVEVHAAELTVFGNQYAGTADLFATVDGVPSLLDVKTSRAIRDSHIGQLAALGAADWAVEQVFEPGEGDAAHKGNWFRKRDIPGFSEYAILQLRPFEEGRDPFCKIHHVPHEQIAAGYDLFIAARDARFANKRLTQLRKEYENG